MMTKKNYFFRFNIIHIFILLALNFIGLYIIPKIICDSLLCFVADSIYFLVVNLFIIYWVCIFGISTTSSFTKLLKFPSSLNDYLMILIIIFGSFIFAYLTGITQIHHLFDFLNTNLQKPLVLPSIIIAKEVRVLMTILILSSTIILVISEELFFRVYLFEKQFFYFGNLTWLLNGIFWSAYHLFGKSNLIEFLPIALIYSIVYQKKRNIIITFIAHLIINMISASRYIFPLY